MTVGEGAGARGDARAGRANQWAAPAAQAGPQTLSGARATSPSLIRKKSMRGARGSGKVRASPHSPPSKSPRTHIALRNHSLPTDLGNDSDRAGGAAGVLE